MDEYHIYQPPQYKGIREDLNLVTHVSLLMSLDSISKLHAYLNENNIENFLFNEKTQHYRPVAVTVAYSHQPISFITPRHDKESFTVIEDLDRKIIVPASTDLDIGHFIDPDGQILDVAVIRSPEFEKQKSYLEELGAVWHLGDFLPFIKINDQTTLPPLGKLNLPEFTDDLVFDRVRYMLFGESKTLS